MLPSKLMILSVFEKLEVKGQGCTIKLLKKLRLHKPTKRQKTKFRLFAEGRNFTHRVRFFLLIFEFFDKIFHAMLAGGSEVDRWGQKTKVLKFYLDTKLIAKKLLIEKFSRKKLIKLQKTNHFSMTPKYLNIYISFIFY